MGDELRQQIYIRLSQKATAELVEIWQTNDRAAWTDAAIDVIREIPLERLVELPPQGEPVCETRGRAKREPVPDEPGRGKLSESQNESTRPTGLRALGERLEEGVTAAR